MQVPDVTVTRGQEKKFSDASGLYLVSPNMEKNEKCYVLRKSFCSVVHFSILCC